MMRDRTARERIAELTATYEADIARLTREHAADLSFERSSELRRFHGYLAEMRFWAEVLDEDAVEHPPA